VEKKMGQVTSSQLSQAQQRHYDLESQIMTMLRDMSLGEKEKLVSQLPGIIDKL
jgi:hypothetical protein